MLPDVGGHRDVNRCISARSDDTVLQRIVRRMLRHLTLDVKFDLAHILGRLPPRANRKDPSGTHLFMFFSHMRLACSQRMRSASASTGTLRIKKTWSRKEVTLENKTVIGKTTTKKQAKRATSNHLLNSPKPRKRSGTAQELGRANLSSLSAKGQALFQHHSPFTYSVAPSRAPSRDTRAPSRAPSRA